MHWPQFSVLLIASGTMTLNTVFHNKPISAKRNAFIGVGGTLVYLGILYAGGFFTR